VVFSEKKVYTGKDPLQIQMDEGIHEITGMGHHVGEEGNEYIVYLMLITCSHITFVGKGKDQTTMRGGFFVENKQHVRFEEMTVTNANGPGLYLQGGETNVDVLNCIAKECRGEGMWVHDGATVTATQCEFMENGTYGVCCQVAKATLTDCMLHHNEEDGLWAHSVELYEHTVVDLHGSKTGIHSNKNNGILADGNAYVNIHLPSQHNTTHDNVRGDRDQDMGGSIANINADGTFTH
jgi:hypothetical protein